MSRLPRRIIRDLPDTTAISDLAGSRRILVVGSPGSGKSHFADEAARVTGLPVVRLDDLYWDAGWQRPPAEEFGARLSDALRRDRWILDGNYADTLPARLERADAVVLIDRAPARCLAAVALRGLLRAAGERASLPARVRADRSARRQRVLVDPSFLRKVVGFRSRVRPSILAAIDARPTVKLVRVPDRRAARDLLERLEAAIA